MSQSEFKVLGQNPVARNNVKNEGIYAKALKQKKFRKTVPAGNYSGIAPIGGNRYAVVDDKGATDGFHVMAIDIDSKSGKLRSVRHEGFRSSGMPNRDEEGIAFRAADSTVYIAGEADNEILQYNLDGTPTGRKMAIGDTYKGATKNKGLESLTYNAATHRFWTVNEWTMRDDPEGSLVLQAFDDDLQPVLTKHYETHFLVNESNRRNLFGVSDLLALDNGGLLVLERELHTTSNRKMGYVDCAIYYIPPTVLLAEEDITHNRSTLLCQWRTRMNLVRQNLANYEGMCLGPRLDDGSQTIILVADSQAQYKGILRDWFKVVKLTIAP